MNQVVGFVVVGQKDKVLKSKKALYSLKQTLWVWYTALMNISRKMVSESTVMNMLYMLMWMWMEILCLFVYILMILFSQTTIIWCLKISRRRWLKNFRWLISSLCLSIINLRWSKKWMDFSYLKDLYGSNIYIV